METAEGGMRSGPCRYRTKWNCADLVLPNRYYDVISGIGFLSLRMIFMKASAPFRSYCQQQNLILAHEDLQRLLHRQILKFAQTTPSHPGA
jgi:hypothetical protein